LPYQLADVGTRKWSRVDGDTEADASVGKNMVRKIASRDITPLGGVAYSAASGLTKSHDLEHVPHSICEFDDDPAAFWHALIGRDIDQTTGQRLNLNLQALNRRLSITNAPTATPFAFLSNGSISDPSFFLPAATANLPYFIKPLPARIGPDEIAFLEKKGALTVPSIGLRNELLRAYIEFVHPYMPLLELYDFVMIVESGSGVLGRISLILFQAVMFAGSAFVDMHHLHNAGYLSRKEARKDFFQKTRVWAESPSFKTPLLTHFSFFTTLTTNLTALLWSKLYFCSLTIMKLPMIRKIPGIGWAWLPQWLIPSACTATLRDPAVWIPKQQNCGNESGGRLTCEIV